MRDFFLGIGEKQHGTLLPVALIWMGYLMAFIEKRDWKYFSVIIITTGAIIAITATIERFFGYNIFRGESYTQSGSW